LTTDRTGPAAPRIAETWLLLITTYAMVTAGAALSSVTKWTSAYALVAAGVCGCHALFVGPNGRALLSRAMVQLVGAVAFALSVLHTHYTNVHMSQGLGHFLILAQLILLYAEHRSRDMHLMQVCAVFGLMIAGRQAAGVAYVPAFLLATVFLMANLVAVQMHGSGLRPVGRVDSGPAPGRALKVRDLVAAIWLTALVVFCGTAAGFIALPRFEWFRLNVGGLAGRTVGYSEDVSLKDVGLLRESHEVALRVKLYTTSRGLLQPYASDHVLMRGTSLPVYGDGEWFGFEQVPESDDSVFLSTASYLLTRRNVPVRRVVQEVEAERELGGRLFALYRPLHLRGALSGLSVLDQISHQIVMPSLARGPERYVVTSILAEFPPEMLRAAGTPDPQEQWMGFWQIPPDIGPAVNRAALEIERAYAPATDYDRVVAAMSYLRDPGRFAYTYYLPEFGRGDPVVAFLEVSRQGSCEQFASALALIARVWGIPTRLVVGFKDGSFDDETQSYVFRNSDAHAWVEVCFNEVGWVEFDPTPARALAVPPEPLSQAFLGRVARRMGRAVSWVEGRLDRAWRLNVVGYDSLQQRRVFERVSEAASDLAGGIGSGLRKAVPALPDLGLWPIALAVGGLTLLVLAAYFAAQSLRTGLLWARRGPRRDSRFRFYDDLIALLDRRGISRAPDATPRELARIASVRFARASRSPQAAGRAVDLITELYCRARFGDYELTPAHRSQIRRAMQIIRSEERAAPG